MLVYRLFREVTLHSSGRLYRGSLLNHLITSSVFFHWFSFVAVLTFVFMFLRICLLILPLSGFVGLISLHVGLFRKFGLWSLSVMKVCFLSVMSILSSNSSFVAVALSAAVMFSLQLVDSEIFL